MDAGAERRPTAGTPAAANDFGARDCALPTLRSVCTGDLQPRTGEAKPLPCSWAER